MIADWIIVAMYIYDTLVECWLEFELILGRKCEKIDFMEYESDYRGVRYEMNEDSVEKLNVE